MFRLCYAYKRWGCGGFDSSLELSTGGIDVATAGSANVRGHATLDEHLLEDRYVFGLGLGIWDAWAGIPDDEIDLGPHAVE